MAKPTEKQRLKYNNPERWAEGGDLRYWPKHMDEVYRKAYPELHKRIKNFYKK